MKENYIIKTDEKDNSEGDGSTATIFAFLLLICICLVSVGFSVQSTVDNRELKKRIIKLEQHDSIYQEFYYSLVDSNEKKSFLVVATTCNAVKEQTDNTPDRTSCQTAGSVPKE